MKVYHGNSEKKELIGTCKTQKEAFDIIENYVKSNNEFASPYYRFWRQGGQLTIDYGMHNSFYYIDFEEDKNGTEV